MIVLSLLLAGGALLISLIVYLRQKFALPMLGHSQRWRDWITVVSVYLSGTVLSVAARSDLDAPDVVFVLLINALIGTGIYWLMPVLGWLASAPHSRSGSTDDKSVN